MKCERCFTKTNITIMSMFNTQMICISCKTKEETHPDYRKACINEIKELKQGNYNYKGIGKPNNL